MTRLTIIDVAQPQPYTKNNGLKSVHRMVVCRCSCGSIVTLKKNDVTGGKVKSCGCWREENLIRLHQYNRGESGKWKKETAGVEPLQTDMFFKSEE